MEARASNTSIWVFTPSRNTPEELEAILVQRQQLLGDAVDRVRESALTDHKHHQLFVGPRGSGKTFLVSLIVHRALKDGELVDRVRVAWLNEDETCATLLDVLLKIHAALGNRYPSEFPASALAPAYDLSSQAAEEFVGRVLLEALGDRTLLVAVENLDALFESLGSEGQQSLRAFIQEHPKLALVATAQRLIDDLSSRARPFFGFFQTEHLKPLSLAEATELLKNIARLNRTQDVVEFLDTRRGRSRIRALHHLSGGNHRIYIVLSHFITRDSIDALVGPFLKMVDELTPYYQERVRWLAPLQRRIVEQLCRCDGPVPVKEIAKRLFGTQQTISRQLQELREKGYVEANARGREMLYEVSEPLMRMCVEVKENSVPRPLRLLVDFLRAWYDEAELSDRLVTAEPTCIDRTYLESALERNREVGSLRRNLLMEDYLGTLQPRIAGEEWDELSVKLAALPEPALLALQCWSEGRQSEGDAEWKRGLEREVEAGRKATLIHGLADVMILEGSLLLEHGKHSSAAVRYSRVIGLPGVEVWQLARALVDRGVCLRRSGDVEAAKVDYTRVIEMPGAPVAMVARALFNRGLCHGHLRSVDLETQDYTRVIELPGAPVAFVARALVNRACCHGESGEADLENSDYTRVVDLIGAPIDQVALSLLNRGVGYWRAGKVPEAGADWLRVIALPAAPVEWVLKAAFNLAELHWASGRWQEGLASLETALDRGSKTIPRTFGSCADIVGVLFSAGLAPGVRRVRVAEVVRSYARHQALASLGEGVVRHIGKLFQKGVPFPSSDNLNQWLEAWQHGAAAEPDFQLALRLLRVGVEFVKVGGKDPTVLLAVPAVERSILRQALGLEEVE